MVVIRFLIIFIFINSYSQVRICNNFKDYFFLTKKGYAIYSNHQSNYWTLFNGRKKIDVKLKTKNDTLTFTRNYKIIPKNGDELKEIEEKYIFNIQNKTKLFKKATNFKLKPINNLSNDFFNNNILNFKKTANYNLNINDFNSLFFSFYDNLKGDYFSLKVYKENSEFYINKVYKNNDELIYNLENKLLSNHTTKVLLSLIAQSGIRQINRTMKGNEASHCYTDYMLRASFNNSCFKIKEYQIAPFYLRCLEKYLLSFFKFYEE
jgi:hypothetical protein